ncbi:hypothetical protein Tco_0195705 [Tanacetum coccineum]
MMWAKEIPSWVPDFVEDNDEETDTNDETNEEDPNGEDIGLKISSTWEGDNDVEVVPDSKFEEDLHKTNVEEVSVGKNDASSEDPFNLYDLLNKKKDDNNKGSNADDSLKYPPCYTPIDVKEAIEEHSNMRNKPKRASGECFHSHFKKAEIPRSGGSILQLMDDMVKVGQTMGYNMEGKGEVVIMGDFNEVGKKAERFGSVFNVQGAVTFYLFISNAGLEELLELEKLQSLEVAQKAKIKWAIEGDENSKYYRGGNSFFITLILKTPDANMVNDFRPISIIGSIYKLIAKILANRLVVVLGNLVNEVQLAFVADRQILDGLFILNGLFQWSKWCAWIQNRLRSSRGSVIMKSACLVPKEWVDCIGITLGSSLLFSHMFYADDAIFVGQWNESNINPIIHVLDCFHRASGLRINMSKSKLMGISVDADKVDKQQGKLVVLLLTTFTYLDKGDLGVSSLYALNEALCFKWSAFVWRFFSQSSTSFHGARVIKAIHEEDGKIGKKAKSSSPSIWLDIVHEVELFKDWGTDLLEDFAVKTLLLVGYVCYTDVSSYEEWLVWMLNLRLSVKYKLSFEGVCYVMWWHVWSFRNKSVFGLKIPSKAA